MCSRGLLAVQLVLTRRPSAVVRDENSRGIFRRGTSGRIAPRSHFGANNLREYIVPTGRCCRLSNLANMRPML